MSLFSEVSSTTHRARRQILNFTATSMLFLVGVFIWLTFRPGLLSPDSINQYAQAATGQFNDWHPPIMAVILSIVMKYGGSVDTLIFLQCQAGLFGIKTLVGQLFDHFNLPQLVNGSIFSSILSLLIALLLLLPITPNLFYLVAFWKDSWLSITLLWLSIIILKLVRANTKFPAGNIHHYTVGILLLAIFVAGLRYNALILLPLISLVTAFLIRNRLSRLHFTLILILPVIFFLILNSLIKKGFGVTSTYNENIVMASDLVGVCVIDPAVCNDLPFTKKSIIDPDYRKKYVFGISAHFYDKEYLIVNPEYVGIGAPNTILINEYFTAAKRYPLILLKVKYHALLNMLRPKSSAYYWFHSSIEPNSYNLQFDERFHSLRHFLVSLGLAVSRHRYLHLISGEHLIWVLINLFLVLCRVILFVRRRQISDLALVGILTITLAYYGSYIMTVTQWDFRFMYPSTMLVQILFSSFLIEFSFRYKHWLGIQAAL